MPNIIKNPKIWIPPILASVITGPLATCLFKLKMKIGIITGWFEPSKTALMHGETCMIPTLFDWAGLILICFVLPAILSTLFCNLLRKLGWIKKGDLLLS